MTNIKNEILNWIGDKDVDIYELTEFIHSQLGNKYEFGDAGYVINEMLSVGILQADNANKISKGNNKIKK